MHKCNNEIEVDTLLQCRLATKPLHCDEYVVDPSATNVTNSSTVDVLPGNCSVPESSTLDTDTDTSNVNDAFPRLSNACTSHFYDANNSFGLFDQLWHFDDNFDKIVDNFRAAVPDADSDSVLCDDDSCLTEEVAEWAVLFDISHAALGGLLKILKKRHQELPQDPRILLKTCTEVVVKSIDSGSYYHFGILNSIINIFDEYNIEQGQIDLQINIDGLPLLPSTNGQFWPILG